MANLGGRVWVFDVDYNYNTEGRALGHRKTTGLTCFDTFSIIYIYITTTKLDQWGIYNLGNLFVNPGLIEKYSLLKEFSSAPPPPPIKSKQAESLGS